MSIVVRFAPPSMTVEQYDEAIRRLNFGGGLPDGCNYHVCYKGPDGNWRVSEIWDSEEQLRAFGESLMPILAEIGIDPGQPEIMDVHNIVKRPS
jgi:hypothetical protein